MKIQTRPPNMPIKVFEPPIKIDTLTPTSVNLEKTNAAAIPASPNPPTRNRNWKILRAK